MLKRLPNAETSRASQCDAIAQRALPTSGVSYPVGWPVPPSWSLPRRTGRQLQVAGALLGEGGGGRRRTAGRRVVPVELRPPAADAGPKLQRDSSHADISSEIGADERRFPGFC
jgi:hypothetical protein